MFFYSLNYIMEQVRVILYTAPAILFAVTCHEYAHGRVSEYLGDPTPRASGRLTLNPLKHLDLWGTLCLLFFHVGWAKPVPISPYYYRNRRKGIILVSLAGPTANFLVALISVLAEGLLVKYGSYRSELVMILILLAEYSARINIGLAVFNLIPIPPLDGSKILGELFFSIKMLYARWEPYWIWILLLLLLTGVLTRPLAVCNQTIFETMLDVVMKILGVYTGGRPMEI